MKRNLLLKSMALMFALVGWLSSVEVYAQQDLVNVSVTVVDESGTPVIGATVIPTQNTSKAVATDVEGVATIAGIPANESLLIQSVGYANQTVPVNGQTKLMVTMLEDATLIDQVVVVGYGSQKKVNLTGAVAVLDGDALESRPVANVQQALQGQVAGLNLNTNNLGGELGNSMSMNIRGAGTIGSGSSASPLVLIDGVEGSLNTLSPNDIESFSVLKDAAASSIYGSRAAFGVILVTTKQGKEGKTTVNYNGNFRMQTLTSTPNMMDGLTFAKFYNDASINDGSAAVFNDETMGLLEQYVNGEITTQTRPNALGTGWMQYSGSNGSNNWFDEHYREWSPAHEHNLSITGGNEKTNYRISGTLLDQTGMLEHGTDGFNRYNINASINAQMYDWLKVSFNTKWSREELEQSTYSARTGGLFYHNVARRWPTVAAIDNNGYYTESSEIIQQIDGGRSKRVYDALTNQINFTAEPIEGWRIVAEAAYRTNLNTTHTEILPVYDHTPDGAPRAIQWNGGGGYAAGYSYVSEYTQNANYFNTNIYTDYSTSFGDHNFKIMGGFNAEENWYRDLTGSRQGLITPSVPTLNTATTEQRSSGGYADWATAGFFARLNYDYQEKYLFEANFRYDGASRFIGEGRWGAFPSFSAGWNVTREDFMESTKDVISLLKVRGSWGQLGNMATSSWYPFYQTMPTGVASGSWLVDGVKPNTSYAPGMVSDALTWETVQSWNIGIDFGLFDNRLTGSFDYFERTTLDMVGPAPTLPSTLGTSPPQINNADWVSKGFELELAWRDRIGEVTYGVKAVLSDAAQTITSYPNPTNSLSTWYNGRVNGEIWGYTSAGIAQSDEQMNAHLANNRPTFGSNWAAGDMMYVDLNGDGEINNGANSLGDSGDISIIGNSTARYNYGITADVSWNGFDFSMFWQGTGARDFFVSGPYMFGASGGIWQSTGFVEHMDYWRPEGDALGANTDAYYTRALINSGWKNQQTQTGYLQDASYIRLKNVQLGYTLPREVAQQIGIQNVRFYVSADNLLTFTKLSTIFDPEALGGQYGNGKIYPLQTTISAGINLTF